MKKVLTILVVLTLVAGFAFAASGDKVVLTSAVEKIVPVVQIKTGSTVGSQSGAEVDTGKSIADESISATFVIYQNNTANAKEYSRYSGDIALTVTCGAFVKTDDANEKSALPSIDEETAGHMANIANTLTYSDTTFNNNIITFNATYAGRKVTNAQAANLGTFTATWAQAPTLPHGDYTATITLTYSAS